MTIWKTFLARVKFRQNGRIFGWGTCPEADWKVIFITMVVLIVLTIVFNILMFIQINRGAIFVTVKPEGNKQETLNPDLLRQTISYYQGKVLEFERIQKERASSTDPSL